MTFWDIITNLRGEIVPYISKDAARAYNSRYYKNHQVSRNANRKYNRTQKVDNKPFIGVDGEGGNIEGRHEYLLLRAGAHKLYTGKPLSSYECLDFISNLPNNGIYVGYFFDYDVTMILRDLPEERLRRLVDREIRTVDDIVLPVEWSNFEIEWLPSKEFKVRNTSHDIPRWVVISDVGSFFQSSFLSAIEKWNIGSPEQREQIKIGKSLRSKFTNLDEETDLYNTLEIDLLERLMTQLRSVFLELEIRPRKWQGPGNVAGALLKKHGIPTNKEIPLFDNPEFLDALHHSYYGGWFEVQKLGEVGKGYQYDINSAYPAAMLHLPCLIHSTVEFGGKKEIAQAIKNGRCHDKPIYLAHISFVHKNKELLWGSFPWRNKKGNISHPVKGSGWYWSWEIENKLPGTSVVIGTAYIFIKNCDCKPFEFVENLYEMRKKVGKDSKGIALKLALNSLYGKMAQSVGKPQFANPIYASLITSYARSKILDVIRQKGNDVCMVATDAVFSSTPCDQLIIDKELGNWSCDEYESLFIIQPGLYILNGEMGTLKTRGVAKTLIAQELPKLVTGFDRVMKCRSSFESAATPAIEIHPIQFQGLKLACARLNFDTNLGQWVKTTKKIGYDWHTKRGDIVAVDSVLRNVTLDMIDVGSQSSESNKYSKDLGVSMQSLIEDQPDWVYNSLGVD